MIGKVTYKVVMGCPVLFLKLSHRLYEIARIQAKLQLVKTKVDEQVLSWSFMEKPKAMPENHSHQIASAALEKTNRAWPNSLGPLSEQLSKLLKVQRSGSHLGQARGVFLSRGA